MTRIVSWNVNGIRAAARNGFLDWLSETQPDIVCLQETRAHPEQVPAEVAKPAGYAAYWHPARKPGYSGVATFTKREPQSVAALGVEEFDAEGRAQVLEYPSFTIINAYFPNSRPERARLEYKLAFCDALRTFCNRLRDAGRNVVLCGDFNIAHKAIDLARPNENENNPGYYPEERDAMDQFIASGYVDTFRHFCADPGHYTWWSYRGRAREKNIGWRLDYHCVNEGLMPRVHEARILSDVAGSDHCPVSLSIE